MLNLNRKITTRDGRAVRVLCSDRKLDKPLIALVQLPSGSEEVHSYELNGFINIQGGPSTLDLINPSIEEEKFMVLRAQGTLSADVFPTRSLATEAYTKTLATTNAKVVKVRITVVED